MLILDEKKEEINSVFILSLIERINFIFINRKHLSVKNWVQHYTQPGTKVMLKMVGNANTHTSS